MGKNIIEILISGDYKAGDAFDQSAKNLDQMGKNMQKVGGIIVGVGAAINAALFAMVNQTAKTGDQHAKFERQTGVSAQTMAGLTYAIKRMGGEQSDLEAGVRKLSKAMSDADLELTTYQRTFDRMHISVKNTDGTLKTFEQILPEIAKWFSINTDVTLKQATAIELFGRGGLKLIPLLNQSAAGIKELTDRAEELHIIYDDKLLGSSEDFIDANLDLKMSLQGLRKELSENLMPAMTDIINQVTDVVVVVADWADAHPQLSTNIFKTATALMGAGGLVLALGTTLRIMARIKTMTIGMGTTLFGVLGPGGLIATAIVAGAIYGFKQFDDALKENRKELEKTIKAVKDGIIELDEVIGALPAPLNEDDKRAIEDLFVQIDKIKGMDKDATFKIITDVPDPAEVKDASDALIMMLARPEDLSEEMKIKYNIKSEILNKEEMIANLREQIDAVYEGARDRTWAHLKPKVVVEPDTDVNIAPILEDFDTAFSEISDRIMVEPIELPFKKSELEQDKDDIVSAFNEIADGFDIIIDKSESPEIQNMMDDLLDRYEERLMTYNQIFYAAFNSGFQGVLRAGNKWSDSMKAMARSLESSIISIFSQMLAKMAAKWIMSGFLRIFSGGVSPISPWSQPFPAFVQGGGTFDFQKGGTVVELQPGGTAITGVRGVDTIDAKIGKGETVITHDTTDRLDAFLEAVEEGKFGGSSLVIQAGVITGSPQDVVRFGREVHKARAFENDYIVEGAI